MNCAEKLLEPIIIFKPTWIETWKKPFSIVKLTVKLYPFLGKIVLISYVISWFHFYLACLLITFANSLEPDQYRKNVGPDLDTDRLTL